MQSKTGKIVMGLIALIMALAFFAPPVIKLKDPAMIIVILIGVAAMVYNFIEIVREKDDPDS
jgi:4-hydroxybenzoate polyprenyltransferase